VTVDTWRAVPLKYVADINESVLAEETAPDRSFDYIDISAIGRGQLVSVPVKLTFREAPSRARRLMRRGDTLVSTVRTYLRAVWTVDIDPARLVASTGIAVISPRPAIHPRFMSWYLQSDPFIDKMVARSVGVSYPAINPADLGRLIVQFPPLSEQRWIASFLDDEISRIDALIARRRRMLELLSERATATITSDFGSRIGLSAAGIPDSVGQHSMVRLGAVSTVQSGLTLDAGRELDDSAVSRPYLRVANVQDGRVDLSETREVDVPLRLATRCELRTGDVLMTEGGDPDKLGRGTVWRGEVAGCLHQNHIFAVRPAEVLLPDFLALVTRTPYARTYFEVTASKTTGIASTSTSKIASFRIPLPGIDEQERIVDRASARLGRIDELSRAVECQIALLRERRGTLITAAVTGGLGMPDPLAPRGYGHSRHNRTLGVSCGRAGAAAQ